MLPVAWRRRKNLFETFAVGEVLRSYMNADMELRDVWFYRDSRKREIDLVIQEGRVLYPVEIKAATVPETEAVASFSALKALSDYEVGTGAVICSTDRPYPLGEDAIAISPREIRGASRHELGPVTRRPISWQRHEE